MKRWRTPYDWGRAVFRVPLLERGLARWTAERPYGSWVTKLAPNSYSYPPGSTRRVTRRGVRYDLDLAEMHDWWIFFGFRNPATEALYDLVDSGQTVLDVGSNVGEVLMNLAAKVGPSGRVVGFEPHPETWRRLQHNLSLNPFGWVETHPIGFGETPGRYPMQEVAPGNPGMNRISPAPNSDGPAVEIRRLDDFVAGAGIERIDLVKIDTEGFELAVLKGAALTLERLRPVLFIELDDENLQEQGDDAAALVRHLNDAGYTVKTARDGREVTPATLPPVATDVVATPTP